MFKELAILRMDTEVCKKKNVVLKLASDFTVNKNGFLLKMLIKLLGCCLQ